jgi:hypothetical protein
MFAQDKCEPTADLSLSECIPTGQVEDAMVFYILKKLLISRINLD